MNKTGSERMAADLAWLDYAAEVYSDDAWLQSSLFDLASAHTAQMKKIQELEGRYLHIQACGEWAIWWYELFNRVAKEKFGTPPILYHDFLLPPSPIPDVEKLHSQLQQLRKSIIDGLDGPEVPHINTIRKWLRAVARIERQLIGVLADKGVLLDSERFDEWGERCDELIISWSKTHFTQDQWCEVFDTVDAVPMMGKIPAA